MEIEQLYTSCLAQGTYFIQSGGEIAVIDPLREINQYVEKAKSSGGKIKYIFETHFHADFVSGHLTLSKKTGATIIYGPNANPAFDYYAAKDGEVFKLGDISIQVLHTPGHTLESTCYLLKDAKGKDKAIFTGDTLFLGDVGRPDLAQKNGSLTAEDLAGMMYDSLRSKILPLSDDIMVYPAHGAGSACGKNMMSITKDSLGNQKKVNYALNPDLSKSDFIKELINGLGAPPAYFPLNVHLNKNGYSDIDKVLEDSLKFLSPESFHKMSLDSDITLIDVRSKEAFTNMHIPGSIFIGLDGDFAPWIGAIVKDVHKKILIVAPKDRERETLIRLSRVGFDNVQGFLKGGLENWEEIGFAIDSINTVEATDISIQEEHLFDVRKPSEFTGGKIGDAVHTPLSKIEDYLEMYNNGASKVIYCRSGYRSLIAISILKNNNIKNLINVNGGYNAVMQELACVNNK